MQCVISYSNLQGQELNVFSEKTNHPMWRIVRKSVAQAFQANNMRCRIPFMKGLTLSASMQEHNLCMGCKHLPLLLIYAHGLRQRPTSSTHLT